MERKILTGLISETYEHPFDRKALASLQKMPGASPLLKKINEYGLDRLLRLQRIGSQIKVTPRNFPRLHEAMVETCRILDVSPIPDLYLFRGFGNIETYIIGVEKPIIGINLEGMEWLDEDELIYVLGYEVARIKSRHLLYHQMALVMPSLKTFLSNTTLGIGGLLAGGLELALSNWVMMAKFTADRAGLLACQDIDVAITALIKIAGLPSEYLTNDVVEEFIAQAKDFGSDNINNLDQITRIFSYGELDRSWAVMRACELLKWVDLGEYDNIINPTEEKILEGTEGWNFLGSW